MTGHPSAGRTLPDDPGTAHRHPPGTSAPEAVDRPRLPTRRHQLFLIGAGLIALHVVDDSFLQPQDGTSATDHLAGGLIPVALLALAAWAFPRLKAGAQACLALFFGVLGVVIGAAEAGYYTLKVGPSGDDFTGLLAIPAGLLLLGLGVAALWSTRRRDDGRLRRYVRRALITVAGVVTVLEVVFPLAFTYTVTHVARPVVPPAELGAPYKDVSFTTSDGLTLEGWYVESRNGAAVISFPGRKGPQAQARMLARHGYGVLLFDRRGEGASDGDGNMFGWGGEQDIFAAVEFLKDQPDVDPDRIGGIGLSVGGELMLQAAAENHDLAAVVSEGAGTRTFTEDVQEFSGPELWLGYPFLAVKTAGTALWSNTMPPPSLTTLVPRIAPRPVFLIWSSKTPGEGMTETYHRLAGEPKAIWEIPEAEHVQGIKARPREYERRVVGFFDSALLGAR
jgi:hypothetical protein